MNVYYNDNGNIWGRGKREDKLACFPIRQTFLWEGQEVFIPAIYVGTPGAILDICTKISSEDMIGFLDKWNYEKRLSVSTQEKYELLDAENPGSREFKVEASLDNLPLTLGMFSSVRWYPDNIILRMDMDESAQHLTKTDNAEHSSMAWDNDSDAEALMKAYDLDQNCCWHLERLVYHWNEAPILSPHKISLHFKACPISLNAGQFTTDLSCKERILKIIHPQTGQEYTLTLHKCQQFQTSFAQIAQEGMCYPENSLTLFYSISPECDRNLVHIQDLSHSEQPKLKALSTDSLYIIGDRRYATSVFVVGKSPEPDKEMAISSLHFSPVTEVCWQVVFQVKPREDMEISFPILSHT